MFVMSAMPAGLPSHQPRPQSISPQRDPGFGVPVSRVCSQPVPGHMEIVGRDLPLGTWRTGLARRDGLSGRISHNYPDRRHP